MFGENVGLYQERVLHVLPRGDQIKLIIDDAYRNNAQQ